MFTVVPVVVQGDVMAMTDNDNLWPFEVTDVEKAKAFDSLLSKYFNANFGTLTKSEFELMLFSFYYDQCQRAECRDRADYTSDYALSKKLGITQTRVRSLKLRKSLKEPEADDAWTELFARSIENAKYDDKSGLIKMIVPDITVLVELRHIVEMLGWYDEYQLNPKLFQCPPGCLIELCNKLCKSDELLLDKEAIERLQKEKERIEKETGNDQASKQMKSLAEFMGRLASGATLAGKVSEVLAPESLKIVISLLGKVGPIAAALQAFAQGLA